MKKMFKVGLAIAAAVGMLALMLAGHGGTVHAADTTAQAPQFMVYYRAWRDKMMQGVNTSLPDKNTIAMTDLPTGIDIVNVFSYVPAGQEAQAQPFFDTLKSTYAPAMHARGVKLVRAIGYASLINIPEEYGGENPTPEQFDAYAQKILHDLSGQWGLDGLDIDMEEYPSADEVKLSDGMINALSKYIGPKSGNPDTRFIYDTNGSFMDPFENVKNAFNFLGYQQYGSTSARTARAVADYEKVGFNKNQFLAGLTFPEEQDNNRWYDTDPIYTNSHIYDIAKYVRENQLGGMFMYAVDRDGRTYEDDSNRIVPTTFAWTKAALEEVKGITLDQAKAIANFYLNKNKAQWTAEQVKTAQAAINDGQNIYDVNKAFLNDDYSLALSPIFDPLAVKAEMAGAQQKAEAAVEKAEASQSQTDVDAAKELVAALPEGDGQKALTARLAAVQKNINDAVNGAANGKADGYARKTPASNVGLSDAYVKAYNDAYKVAKSAADQAAGTEDGTADGKKGRKRDISKESKDYQDAYNTAYDAAASVVSEPIKGTAVIDQTKRNDGLYSQIPADNSYQFTGYGMAKDRDLEVVTLLRKATIGKTTWYQVRLSNGDQVWIDHLGLQLIDTQEVSYDAVIDQTVRNDGLYSEIAYTPSGKFIGFDMARRYDGQSVKASEEVTIDQTVWVKVRLGEQTLWIDKRGLLQDGKYTVRDADYYAAIVSVGRKDGLYTSVPTKPGEKFTGFGMAKTYNSQLGHVSKTVTINDTTWVLMTVGEQSFWLDSKGTATVKATANKQSAVIDQTNRNDGLYRTIATAQGTEFKGFAMASKHDQKTVTIVLEVTVGKTTWAQIQFESNRVWIDKAGLQITK